MFHLTPETEEDGYEVEYLYDLAFAPGREALSSYRLREGVAPVAELCLAARDEYGVLAGAIRYWPVVIGPKRDTALLLGPVAVHPTYQGEGLGGLLVRDSLERARETLAFPPPTNPERLLCRALEDGAFDGVAGRIGSVLV